MCSFSGILIATDLDGTFVSSKAELVPRNLEAIERFKAGGGLFTFATGRVIWSMASIVPLYKEIVNAPMVLCNGATLHDPVAGKDIYNDLLDEDSTVAAVRLIRNLFPETTRIVYVGENYFQYRDTEGDEGLLRQKGRGWHKVLVQCPADIIDKLEETMRAQMPGKFAYSRSSPVLFELLPPGSTKGRMLKRLKEYYAARGKPVTLYAVGDFDNDIDMLRSADVACCPSNALDSVKAVCDIVLGSWDGGAIADLIEILEKEKAR